MFRDAPGSAALQGWRKHRSAVKRRNYDTDQWALGSAASTRWRSSFGRPSHSPRLSSILNSRWKFFSAFQKSSLRRSSLSIVQKLDFVLYDNNFIKSGNAPRSPCEQEFRSFFAECFEPSDRLIAIERIISGKSRAH